MEKPSFESLGNEQAGVGNEAVLSVKREMGCDFCEVLKNARETIKNQFKQKV